MPPETKHLNVAWLGDLRFEGSEAGRPVSAVDGDGAAAMSPVTSLLLAAAGCTLADVVLILRKMRVDLTGLRAEVFGTRREQEPRRFVAIRFVFHCAGAGLDEARARRAIDLSLEKYCSVVHSLAKDIDITYELVLGGAGEG